MQVENPGAMSSQQVLAEVAATLAKGVLRRRRLLQMTDRAESESSQRSPSAPLEVSRPAVLSVTTGYRP
jgi:hypothetical protein